MVGELPGDFLRSDAQLNRSHGEQASQAWDKDLFEVTLI